MFQSVNKQQSIDTTFEICINRYFWSIKTVSKWTLHLHYHLSFFVTFIVPIPMVLPWSLSPSPRFYRWLYLHSCGITANFVPITAVLPRLPQIYRCPHPHAALSLGGHVWCEVRSLVSQQLSAVAHVWCTGKQKSPAASQMSDSNCLSSKTSQYMHHSLSPLAAWKRNLETPTKTDTQEHVCQKPMRDINELKQHLTETWSATSRASLIKRLISGKIVLMHVS